MYQSFHDLSHPSSESSWTTTHSLDIFPLEHVPAGVRGYPVGVLGAADPVVTYPVGVLGAAVPLVGVGGGCWKKPTGVPGTTLLGGGVEADGMSMLRLLEIFWLSPFLLRSASKVACA